MIRNVNREKKRLMKIHFQHTFIQGIFTKWAIVSSYDLDLQLYATLSDIRNNWHSRHVAVTWLRRIILIFIFVIFCYFSCIATMTRFDIMLSARSTWVRESMRDTYFLFYFNYYFETFILGYVHRFYLFKCKDRISRTYRHIRSVLEAFFTTRQPLTRACFSIACESCFTGACVRSNSIATNRINVTTVRVGRTLVDICIRIVSYIKG